MLEALYPGRIDLGLGRAPGSDGLTANALAPTGQRLALEYYPQQLLDLYSYLTDDFPPDHPNREIHASPRIDTVPELWLLGSSDASARYAGELGWAFSFAQFINPLGGPDLLRLYRDSFEPSPLLERPQTSIGVSVTCAETTEEAEYLSWSRWAWRFGRGQASGPGIPSPEEAMAYKLTPPEQEYLDVMKQRSIYGDPKQVRGRLLDLGEEFGVDELVVVTITYDHGARLRSYELLAEAFGLTPAG
jgi:luciferase family oxidoreductase group 1